MENRDAGYVNIALGSWLLVSAFLWRQSSALFVNSLLMGFIVIASTVVARVVPGVRYVTAAAGVWLVASLFAWPIVSAPAVWNNCMVGAAIALVSLIGPLEADLTSS
jgi:hypothetical protein